MTEFTKELRAWWAIAWTSSLRSAMELLPWISTLAMVGRLSTDDLASLSLTETYLYGLMIVPWIGLSMTEGTLVSQAHGAKNVSAMRGWGLMTLVSQLLLAVPVALAWTQTGAVLTNVGFDRSLAERGQIYANWAIPCLFFEAFNVSASEYLTSIQISRLPFLLSTVSAVLDVGMTYALIFGKAGLPALGLKGAALAWACGCSASCLMLGCAVYWSIGKELRWGSDSDHTLAVEAEGDWTPLLLAAPASVPLLEPASKPSVGRPASGVRWMLLPSKWRVFVGQAGPNLLTAALQSWQIQILSFLAAELGAVDIAAHNVMLCLLEVIHTASDGMAGATAIRVGYHLGRGDAQAARLAVRVGFCVALGSGIVLAAVGYSLRQYMGLVFTSDESVLSLTTSLAPLFWCAYVLWCGGDQLLATLEGQGRAKAQSASFLLGGWGVALPLAFISWKCTDLGLDGLWGTLCIGLGVVMLTAGWAVHVSKWEDLAVEAATRAQEEEGDDLEPVER